MGKGIQLLLKFFDSQIQTCNHFIFPFKFSFFLFEVVYLNFLSLDFAFKIRNLFVLFLSDCLDDLFFVGLKNIFDLSKVGFDNVCHSAEVLKQRRNFLLQSRAKGTSDIRVHHSDHALNFFLVRGILRYQCAL